MERCCFFPVKVDGGSIDEISFPHIIRLTTWGQSLFIKLPAKSFLLLLEVLCRLKLLSSASTATPNFLLGAAQDVVISGSLTHVCSTCGN